MLNVDYKIIAKIIANRIRKVLHLFISPEQFCSVPGKSISTCNLMLRDLIYYVNDEKIPAALISLDWSKAFDRVDLRFVFKIMKRIGFSEIIVNYIRMMYLNAESCLCINGNLTDFFPIERSVRQGCPLSMILFVIYQEPLYRMLKSKLHRDTLDLPNRLNITLVGFADDTIIVIKSDKSIKESMKIIKDYEEATGAQLNYDKTSIMGLGLWKNRTTWPVEGMKIVLGCFKILGVVYDNDYEKAKQENRKSIEKSIASHIGKLYLRKLSLFQKSIVINCKVLAKAWYMSHVYPVPQETAKSVEKCIFKFIWNGNYHPVNRKTLYLKREKGGIGVIDMNIKAKAIFFSTFYKCIKNKITGYELLIYYCKMRSSYLIETENINDIAILSTPYYNEVIITLRKVIKMENYPEVKAKHIYWYLINSEGYAPKVVENYPLFDWDRIWENVNNKLIDTYDREILYKYVHEVLATRDRLYMMNISTNRECGYCKEPESVMHIMYFCKYNMNVLSWFSKLLMDLCNIKTKSILKILKLEFEAYSSRDRNTAIMLITNYITGIWYSYKLGIKKENENVIKFIRLRVIRNRYILIKAYENNYKKLVTLKYLNFV